MGVVRRRGRASHDDNRRREVTREGIGFWQTVIGGGATAFGALVATLLLSGEAQRSTERVIRGVVTAFAGPPPELPAASLIGGYDLAETHDSLELVARVIGPGYPIPPDEWASTVFRIVPGADGTQTMTLTQFSWQQPGDEVAVYQWYQWGTGPTRLFYATYMIRPGEERVFAKVIDHGDGTDQLLSRARYPYRRVAGGKGVMAVPNPP